ncbi:penicillin-binding protein 2 [Candidatus Saccharibacteria bacterium]|nr:penicillin-binding protein 2 [Candidatus Saccharibacteria bacterium]
MNKKPKVWLFADWRITACAVLGLLGLLAVAWRLFGLQVLRHDAHAERAHAEQTRQWVLPARRGEIFGLERGQLVPLVLNETVYEVFVDPFMISRNGNQKRVFEVLNAVPLEPRQDIRKALDQTTTQYQVIYRNLSRSQAETLRAENLPGVGFKATVRRTYPEQGLAAQTLGFVNLDGVGQYGIEGSLNDRLSGTDGMLRAVTDVNNVPLTIGRENIRYDAVNGEDLVLTLDPSIQMRAEQIVAEGATRAGAAYANILVLCPNTGRIYAMANYPSFDPGNFGAARPGDFQNPILTDAYEAGSVIKTLTMAAAIERSAIRPTDTYLNVPTRMIDGWPVNNFVQQHNNETITYQLAHDLSFNVGTISMLEQMGGGQLGRSGRETLFDFFHSRFFLGRRIDGFPLPNTAGIVPQPSSASNIAYATMTFGQGMSNTMLQIGAAYASVINGGYHVTPQIIAGTRVDGQFRATPEPSRTRVLQESTSRTMRQVLETTRARAFRDWFPDPVAPFTAGGKTGTAQVPVAGGYHPTWAIGSYIGHAGGERPEFIIMTRVGGEATFRAADATWMFNELAPWLADYLQLY